MSKMSLKIIFKIECVQIIFKIILHKALTLQEESTPSSPLRGLTITNSNSAERQHHPFSPNKVTSEVILKGWLYKRVLLELYYSYGYTRVYSG